MILDDDDDWQEMPVIQSSNKANKQEIEKQWRLAREENGEDPDEEEYREHQAGSGSSSSGSGDDDIIPGTTRRRRRRKNPLDKRRKPRQHQAGPSSRISLPSGNATREAPINGQESPNDTKTLAGGNATGVFLETDTAGRQWRAKGQMDEQDYTRLELDEDPEEDEIHTQTQYLFDDDKGMTPLSQMQTTKTMLSDPQRIAYVGLCRLVTREMATAFNNLKELQPAVESLQNWGTKVMGRLYQHMEIDPAEQRMIEQLAEHGVTSADLVPSLVTTHTVPNPQYDPEAAKEAQEEAAREAEEEAEQAAREAEAAADRVDSAWQDEDTLTQKTENLTIQGSKQSEANMVPPYQSSSSTAKSRASRDKKQSKINDDEGDIGTFAGDSDNDGDGASESGDAPPQYDAIPKIPKSATHQDSISPLNAQTPIPPTLQESEDQGGMEKETTDTDTSINLVNPLPNTLPGVTTNLTAADETVTLDIRWTVLCDLFLALVADSVYDARSRVLLCRMAEHLGLSWMDVVRFERRLTEALEIQESIKDKDNVEALQERSKADKRKRYMLMAAATVGGGLVLGLSAGILAPAIAGGLAGALATVGVSGASAALTGAGSAAVITTTGVLTGSSIGGRGMARRTKAVTKFELHPVHNNKRLNVIIAVPGFMNGPQDDVRLPFSTVDPIMGDLLSVLWEPETLGQTGNALKILGSEVLSSVGQQMLQLTLLGAMVSALQWPILLTKLGYLIDNPWSNALDRARQAGEVLAAILIQRGLGVRPVTLVGFSLGARVIFYTLVALAKKKAFGIVQDVYLMGTTVTASRKTWCEIRGVVAGRFVNCYARNDWILGYLFRATTGGIGTVAGLRPVELVPDLENVDITDLLAGHMSYRSLMPLILKELGFRVTADSFDEPEDLDRPDREVLTPEQELARLQAQKKASWLSRFKKDKTVAGAGAEMRSSSGLSGRASSEGSTRPAQYDGETLPERELTSQAAKDTKVEVEADLGVPKTAAEETSEEVNTKQSLPHVQVTVAPKAAAAKADTIKESQPPPIKDTGVGFDLDKIRDTIASDDGSGQLPAPVAVAPQLNGQRHSLEEVRSRSPSNANPNVSGTTKGKSLFSSFMKSKPDLTRTGSAPVPQVKDQQKKAVLPNGRSAEEAAYEAQQKALEEQERREEEAFRNGLPASQLYPATDNPFASSTASLPTLSSDAKPSTDPFAFSSFGAAEQNAPALSFGSVDGNISFAPIDADTPSWQSSSTDTSAGWKDPWQTGSSNAWSSSSRW